MNLDRSENRLMIASIILGVIIIIPLTYSTVCDQIDAYNAWIESKNPANIIKDTPISAPLKSNEASDGACINE